MQVKISLPKLGFALALLLIGYQNITSMYWEYSSYNTGSFLSILMMLVVIISLYFVFRESISITNISFIMIMYYLYIVIVCLFNGYFDLFLQEPTLLVTMALWIFLFCLFYEISKAYIIDIQRLSSIIFSLTIGCFVLFLRYYTANLEFGKLSGLNVVYYLTFMLPFILINRNKKIVYIGLALNLFAALLSGKRGALISLIISWIIWIQTDLKKQSIKKRILKTLLYLVVCLIIVYIINTIVEKFELDILERISALITGEDESGSGRTEIWSRYFDYMGSDNFINTLFGRGYISTKRNPKLLSLSLGWAHNDFIQVLFDYGIIGLLFFCLIIIRLFKISYKMKKRKYKFYRQFLISLLIFMICSCFSMVTIYPQWFLSMAAFWGVVIGKFEREEENNEI